MKVLRWLDENLEEVIKKADYGKDEGHDKDHDHLDITHEKDCAQKQGCHYGDTCHGGNSRLGKMGLRSLLPHLLAEIQPVKHRNKQPDQYGSGRKAYDKCKKHYCVHFFLRSVL